MTSAILQRVATGALSALLGAAPLAAGDTRAYCFDPSSLSCRVNRQWERQDQERRLRNIEEQNRRIERNQRNQSNPFGTFRYF